MPTAIPAEVNPALLMWAREQSGYPPELVAKRLGVKVERLGAWERGELKPTVRQAQELAKYYHRPFGVLFLPQPPSVPPLAAEYRRLPGVRAGVESPEFRLAVRIMLQRREVAFELAEELGLVWGDFRTVAHISEGPTTVGRRLRDALALSIERQLTWRSRDESRGGDQATRSSCSTSLVRPAGDRVSARLPPRRALAAGSSKQGMDSSRFRASSCISLSSLRTPQTTAPGGGNDSSASSRSAFCVLSGRFRQTPFDPPGTAAVAWPTRAASKRAGSAS